MLNGVDSNGMHSGFWVRGKLRARGAERGLKVGVQLGVRVYVRVGHSCGTFIFNKATTTTTTTTFYDY